MPPHSIPIWLLFLKGFSALFICTRVPSRWRWWWWKEQWWQRSKVNVHFNSFTQATPIPLHSIQRVNCVQHFFQSCISFHSFHSRFFHYWTRKSHNISFGSSHDDLRYESSTPTSKELSSPIFQSLSVSESARDRCQYHQVPIIDVLNWPISTQLRNAQLSQMDPYL